MALRKQVTILGSTGSIGRNALDVIRRHANQFDVIALAAFSNAELLVQQATEFKPKVVAIGDPRYAESVKQKLPNVRVLQGPEGIEETAAIPVDITLCAIVGAAGLLPVIRVLENGGVLALANKEPMVMAGALITTLARQHGAQIIPVDSEHSAIWQCLRGNEWKSIHRVYLTASGGPFYGKSREMLLHVSPDEAAKHPTWDMGRKISVDSATLMNKGLEVIEAMWLFQLPVDNIEVIIHPQSIVHGLVEFTDGSMLAHLGPTDMRFPIEYALNWPERAKTALHRLDLTAVKSLTFAAPDFSEFPCLRYALESARRGGTAPAVLNAANEVAVDAFCKGKIPFLAIAETVRQVLERCPVENEISMEKVLRADQQARDFAEHIIRAIGV